ncbi:MAG: bifunctional phosphopantothenoylcysteine decarboxylase/phosphopantothenate--cysteine ligase CoaBC [Candidatus Ancillula sp.]|jgi:phosphopantothenoylcysteine decarboxylase|nr:bifunctional phosphopantothenoylcysteine decarboxylase/phosphopantothenate--cysteine ligase CoaBC [Candidatus Ancillula sp.]
MKTVCLAVTGSIAAYKACDIVSQLRKKKYNVEVLMTENATKLVTPLTFQSLSKNQVRTEVMQEKMPERIDHIDTAKEADLFIIAPATANIIGKVANGIADDIVSTVALACHDIPMLIAPAMNTYMYENPATKENIEKLVKRGWQEIEPKESLLACGDVGKGALANVDTIVSKIMNNL